MGSSWLCWVLAITGRTEELRDVYEPWAQTAPDHSWVLGAWGLLKAAEGSRDEVLAMYEKSADLWAIAWEGDPHGVLYLAEIYAMIHQTDEVMRWLERALEMGIVDYAFSAHYDPCFEYLPPEPRFQEFLEHVKRAWEELEV